MPTPLTKLLSAETVLVTAGQRLAHHLAQRYVRACRDSGLSVWETPVILTFGAWLKRLWETAVDGRADDRLLLTAAQESTLWERVIGDSERSAQLLSVSATAALAREAWTLMLAWELPESELRQAGHEDVQAFSGWADVFDGHCRTHRWLDAARLPNVLADLATQKKIPVAPRIILAGFDELTPQQTRFLDALRRVGADVTFLEHDAVAQPHVVQRRLAAAEDEIVAAAQWARARLQENPSTRIGILAPDLAAQNRALRRVFDDVLLPFSVLPGQEEAARPYNVSFGEPLALQPPIEAAFAVLELARGALPLARLSELLRSPYLVGAETERSRRALLDAQLRDVGDVRVSLAGFARALERANDSASACPILAERLKRLREIRAAAARTQSPSRWLAHLAQLLASLGWPGERSRSSTEHQVVEAWRELLSEFGALDPVLPSLRYGEVLVQLRRLAQEKSFQRETPETPVQILGVLEASGLAFDALWVMGLHDEVWPSAPRPNPFLPVALQRARGLPHASAERELEFCARLTQRLLKSAPTVVLSYPQREEDRDLRPSPLVRELAEATDALSASMPLYRECVHRDAPALETVVDFHAPVLPDGAEVSGGTALFRSQSACPFRAYAEFRLGAREFPEPEPGLDASDRGTLVHELLARLWQELASHAGLVAMPDDQLTARVAELAQVEVEKLQRRRPDTVSDRMLVLERERLVALVLEWLALEKQRAPFSVRREEVGTQLMVAGLRTPARMDRIDELANGDFVVIDYKTGDARVKDWFGERPAEPQLPLYALYGVPPERVSALFYGRVRRGESKFVGLAHGTDVAPGVKPYADTREAAYAGTWEDLFQQWDATLVNLADEHRRGDARVSPRDRLACERCHLHAFCRVPERRARLVDIETDENE